MKFIYRILFCCFVGVPLAGKTQLNLRAAEGLLQRVLPGHAGQFLIEDIASADSSDVFEIAAKGNKIVLSGNTAGSVGSALYYYLNHFCHAQITWNGTNLHLPARLPVPDKRIRKVTPYTYRYYLNYCTFNYSMS